MIGIHSKRSWLCALTVVAMLTVLCGSVVADVLHGDDRILERQAWWPYESGPKYGEVAADQLQQAHVVQLRVGSFDTTESRWNLPQPLALGKEESLTPGSAWLVQLEDPITEDKKEILRAAGATLHRFFPVNTFLVRADNPAALAGLPHVLWAGPYHPAYRIEPELGFAPTADPVKARNESIAVRVRLFDSAEKSRVIEHLEALGAGIDWEATFDPHDKPTRVYFTATPQAILTAARMREVSWIEEVSKEAFQLNAESHVVVQSGSISGGTPYWDAGIDGSSQIVAVMDSGMDVDTILLSHTATDAGTPGPNHRKVHAYSPWGGGDMSTCGSGGYTHGTNTAQCAVANRSDFGMDGNLDGVAKGARIVFQDTGVPGSCGLSTPNPMIGMFDEVRAKGGYLTNGSFVTCAYGSYGSGAFDIDEYAWDHKDFLLFFSGGNGGGGNACPGTNKNNISSGGHYQFPFENEFYGSYGPAPSGRMGPTILAPACDHFGGNPPPFDFRTSASIQSEDNDIVGIPAGESELVEGVCGTSFSSPYLLGVGALIRDYFEKGFWPSGAAEPLDGFLPSGAMVKAALINSGDFVDNCVGCTFPGLMGSMGMGRTNLSSTLALAGNPQTPPGTRIVDRGMAVGLQTAETFEEWVEVLDPSEPLKVTLVWVDRPGSNLVNDLRLTLTGPAGTPAQTFFGNNFGTGAYSLSVANGGVNFDPVNVFEAVRVDPAELVAGVWRIEVIGKGVPMGDPDFGNSQPFALIVSGGVDSLGISEVSAGGAALPLRAIARSAADVTWEWETLADPNIDYSFYRGALDSIRSGVYDHALIDAGHCGIVGGTSTVADAADGVDSYYLVTGHKNGNDGPLGVNRPRADPQCP